MGATVLPNFFIVGTGKAGTTSLYHYLQQHPAIYMSPIKEPCYFASEVRTENLTAMFLRHSRRMSRKVPESLVGTEAGKPLGWLISQWEDYLRLFNSVNRETAIGEANRVRIDQQRGRRLSLGPCRGLTVCRTAIVERHK